MNAGHVALQAAVGDEGLRTPVDQAPEDQKGPPAPDTETLKLEKRFAHPSCNHILVWLFPTVVELMSGELVASAEAPVAALTGERFLKGRETWREKNKKQNKNK